jgi:hypothetical protein
MSISPVPRAPDFLDALPQPERDLPFSSSAMIEGRFERRLKRRDESNLNARSAETAD